MLYDITYWKVRKDGNRCTINENGGVLQPGYGGAIAKEKEYTHMALIGYQSSFNDNQAAFCGGSLISD